MVRLISALLADAVERGASDIHFEPEQNFLRIRYRIDGVLRQIRSPAQDLLAGDGGAPEGDGEDEHRRDARAAGRAHLGHAWPGRVVDFRVASLPTTHGENLVLRILDRQKGIVPLDKLDLEERSSSCSSCMIARPGGHHPGRPARPAAARPPRCTRS